MKNCILPAMLVVAVTASQTVGQESRPTQQIKTAITDNELNSRYEIIGPLGEPLGRVVTITARAIDTQAKGDNELLQVTDINGKALSHPVSMPYSIWPWAHIDHLENNTVYNLRVYQDGGFTGVPEQAMKETVFVQTEGYHFKTRLMVVRAVSNVKESGPQRRKVVETRQGATPPLAP